MITCVLQNGLGEDVLEAAKNAGAQGATISYAQGTGIRDRMGLLGVTIDEQKEVLRLIVSDDQADRVFEAIYLAGRLDTPGKGIMYVSNLENVATHIPQGVLDAVSE
jgi:nitrogen regulatory protein PII